MSTTEVELDDEVVMAQGVFYCTKYGETMCQ